MSSTKITDERLKSWLDTNQLDRERLCQAVLSIDKRFSNVKPRQPRGGPDGGRDLDAKYENVRLAFGAIGFQNSVNDSDLEKRQAIKKFEADLERALAEENKLKVFIFFTNINFTVKQKDSLNNLAKIKGIEYCEIYDRERIRIVLDSPDGFSIRYQYLQLPLSEAEQAAFFSKWGNELQNIISESFEKFDERLSRIQFNLESNRPLRYLAFAIQLSKPISIKELPHFRALLSIFSQSAKSPYQQLHLAVTNNSSRNTKEYNENINDGVAGAFWEKNVNETIQTSRAIRYEPMKFISATAGYSEFDYNEKIPSLSNLDENMFAFFVNKNLVDYISDIKIYANEYLIWSGSKSELSFDKPMSEPETSWEFSKKEMKDEWTRIMLKAGTGYFDFSSFTPARMFESKITKA